VLVTLGIAIVGWSRANRASHHADEALKLARSAEERADRLERLGRERGDVDWMQRDADDRETLSFRNAGSDIAYDVELVVDPADENHPRKQERWSSVGPGDRIGIKLSTLAREAQERFENAGPGILLTPGFTVSGRITWRSELGAPGVKEFDEIWL
jgi:hypothetical protein